MKLKTIIENIENIKALQEVKLPVKASFKMKKIINALQPDLKIYDEKRGELIKEYGTEKEDGKFNVPKENWEEFAKKTNELLAVEIEDNWGKIKIEELEDIKIEPKLLLDFVFND